MLRNLGREHLSPPASHLERGMQQDLIHARTWLTRHSIPVIDAAVKAVRASQAKLSLWP